MNPEFSSSYTMKMLNTILDISPELHGKSYLEAIANNIWKTTGFDYILISYAVKPENKKVQTVVVLMHGQQKENFVYDLADTPCQDVYNGKRVCIYEKNVEANFPKYQMLTDMGVESYIGAPTLEQGELFGLVTLLGSAELDNLEYYQLLAEFLSSRISIELNRYINHFKMMELTKLAYTDPLTGLLNRNEFNRAAMQLIAKCKDSAVLFVDADDFKAIDDNFGHQKGDEVLCMLAETLVKSVRHGDVVARYGREEFILFLPKSSVTLANKVAIRIHRGLQQNNVLPLTVSIGLAIGKIDENLTNLIHRADEAVYLAKKKGKNQTIYQGS